MTSFPYDRLEKSRRGGRATNENPCPGSGLPIGEDQRCPKCRAQMGSSARRRNEPLKTTPKHPKPVWMQ